MVYNSALLCTLTFSFEMAVITKERFSLCISDVLYLFVLYKCLPVSFLVKMKQCHCSAQYNHYTSELFQQKHCIKSIRWIKELVQLKVFTFSSRQVASVWKPLLLADKQSILTISDLFVPHHFSLFLTIR